MRKIIAICFVMALTLTLFAEREVGAGNSYSEYSYIVMVGQVIELTPYSIVFENTAFETRATEDRIRALTATFTRDTDFRAHGMANALRAASVKNGKMRLNFYIDNILKIFDDNVSTYMKYLPLYYLFRNNINDFKLPEATMESLKKQSIDYYISLPMAQELMQNSWLAAVFVINPSNDKLTFKTGRFFDNIDELNSSEWAQEYRIPDIVKAGMTVSMTKAIFIGNESEDGSLEDVNLNYLDRKKEKEKAYNKQKQFDNRKGSPSGSTK
ncbi:hypothetical protein J6W78_00690 [bacterium]|nr:hypothetical protein [bacterium]